MARRSRQFPKSLRSPEHLAFCELMIKVRKRTGLTQVQLASRLHRPQSFVAKYEGGERRIDVIEFLAIAGALGDDPLALLRSLIKSLS
jgi:transcriptional regulator with XRE-family HTH domain